MLAGVVFPFTSIYQILLAKVYIYQMLILPADISVSISLINIYLYVYIYIYMYVYIYICMYIYIYTYITTAHHIPSPPAAFGTSMAHQFGGH